MTVTNSIRETSARLAQPVVRGCVVGAKNALSLMQAPFAGIADAIERATGPARDAFGLSVLAWTAGFVSVGAGAIAALGADAPTTALATVAALSGATAMVSGQLCARAKRLPAAGVSRYAGPGA